ncbi:MAG: CSLREA domain-containing protein [Acidobacteria bacterium]|nr:CSLREA domain-containing protein [Acidobacteriota bacterium]
MLGARGSLVPKGPTLIAFMLMTLAWASIGSAAEIVVTSTADAVTVDSNCTLREALIAANGNIAVDACSAGSAGSTDVILLPAGTITLNLTGTGEDGCLTGDLDLSGDVDIRGAGARSTILDASGLDRLFEVDPGFAGVTVRIADMSLLNGDSGGGEGGGIRNNGTLTLERVTLADNVAAGPGGGIRNNGTVTVIASTLSGNQTNDHGGGIDNHGTAHLLNSTVVGNSVIGGGAGGGLYVNTGESMTFVGSTVLGNSAGNGPAIRNLGSLVAVGSIISGVCSGTVTSSGGNLETPGNTCGLGTGDQANVADPLLDPLGNYGGPTDTLRPQAGSPAIDHGATTACPGLDQRGNHRPADGNGDQVPACDAGAHELAGEPQLFVNGFEAGDLSGWSAVVP